MKWVQMDTKTYRLDERQVADIAQCLWYIRNHNLGMAGHNLMVLAATLAQAHGFVLQDDNKTLVLRRGGETQLEIPSSIEIVQM